MEGQAYAHTPSGSYIPPPSPSQYRSVPASPTANRLPPQPSPTTTTRERAATSSYYDPTSEARASVTSTPYRSPAQVSFGNGSENIYIHENDFLMSKKRHARNLTNIHHRNPMQAMPTTTTARQLVAIQVSPRRGRQPMRTPCSILPAMPGHLAPMIQSGAMARTHTRQALNQLYLHRRQSSAARTRCR